MRSICISIALALAVSAAASADDLTAKIAHTLADLGPGGLPSPCKDATFGMTEEAFARVVPQYDVELGYARIKDNWNVTPTWEALPPHNAKRLVGVVVFYGSSDFDNVPATLSAWGKPRLVGKGPLGDELVWWWPERHVRARISPHNALDLETYEPLASIAIDHLPGLAGKTVAAAAAALKHPAIVSDGVAHFSIPIEVGALNVWAPVRGGRLQEIHLSLTFPGGLTDDALQRLATPLGEVTPLPAKATDSVNRWRTKSGYTLEQSGEDQILILH